MAIDPLARGFANEVEAYELGRPGWPPSALEAAFEQLELGPDSTVVELGAGTGKLTRELLGRVRHVIAVEPLAEMRAALARTTGLEARDGTAESIPVVSGSVDAVFAAEAFHWFHGQAARDEIARILRPGGGLAVMWNRLRGQRPAWWEDVKAVLERRTAVGIRPENRYASMLWRDSLVGDARFGPLEAPRWPHDRTLTAGEYVAMLSSWSVVAGLGVADRAAALAELRGVLAARGLERLDERLETRLYVTHLRSPDL